MGFTIEDKHIKQLWVSEKYGAEHLLKVFPGEDSLTGLKTLLRKSMQDLSLCWSLFCGQCVVDNDVAVDRQKYLTNRQIKCVECAFSQLYCMFVQIH